MMKKYELVAKPIPYSSVVGGGISLENKKGQAKFILNIMGTSQGITKGENDQIVEQLTIMINKNDLNVFTRD